MPAAVPLAIPLPPYRRAMRGIEVPERTEDFTADPVELFFDLAYVFAFSQLVGRLVHHPDWSGVGKTALLFMLLWLPWSQFTWAANAVSGNGRTVRLFFLIGTATSVPMAASVSTAFGSGGPLFAITLSVIVLLGGATVTLALEKGSEVYRSTIRWMVPNLFAMALLVVGAFLDDGLRVAAWIGVVLIVIGAMADAGQGQWIIRPGHFSERHGLIVIIALGEVIVAIGVPVVGSLEGTGGLPASTVVALAASGVFAATMWWSYFDRPGPALEHRAAGIEDSQMLGRFVRDVYTGAHAAIVAGIILVAAALEEIALHPTAEVEAAFRLMLFGGLSLFAGGIAVGVWRAFQAVARERMVATLAVGALLIVGASWDGVTLLVAAEAIIVAALLVEHRRIEG
jgi:low temperature requirement protein LtrA